MGTDREVILMISHSLNMAKAYGKLGSCTVAGGSAAGVGMYVPVFSPCPRTDVNHVLCIAQY